MRLKKINSNKEININISKYKVDWDAPCRSKFQFNVKQWVRPYWQNHFCLEEFRIPGSILYCDFINVNKKIILETNGEFHRSYNKHFHAGSRINFLSQIKRDVAKAQWAVDNGFMLLEIFADDFEELNEQWFIDRGVNLK